MKAHTDYIRFAVRLTECWFKSSIQVTEILRTNSPCHFNSVINFILIDMQLDKCLKNTALEQTNNDMNFHKYTRTNVHREVIVCYIILHRENGILLKQKPVVKLITRPSWSQQVTFYFLLFSKCFQHRSFCALLKNASYGVWTIYRYKNDRKFRLCDSHRLWQETGTEHEHPDRYQNQYSNRLWQSKQILYTKKDIENSYHQCFLLPLLKH